MKMNKFFMLGLAGLAFAACSNEEVIDAAHQNGATVTVRFVGDAITRTVETPTEGNNGETFPVVVKSGSITLTAQNVDGDGTQPITDALNGSSEYTFTGARAPQSIVVVVNGGTAQGMSLADVYDTGLAEPLYGESSLFEQDEQGNYSVEINLERRLARLQFSELSFKTEGTSYSALTLDGIYLNGAVKTEGGNEKAIANDIGAWNTVKTSWSGDAPVFDEINAVIIGDDAQTGPWPGDEKCYAYNIFPASGADNLPKLTVCFSDAAQSNVSGSEYRYARVAKYKLAGDKGSLEGIDNNGYITDFKAGYIYNITDLTLEDGDLGPTPDGQGVQLVATVTVVPWTLLNATVEWE